MAKSDKPMSERDGQQTLQLAFNDVDDSLTTNGFLTGLVGRTITAAQSNGGATVTYTFSESGVTLYTIQVNYTDSTQATFLSATRLT